MNKFKKIIENVFIIAFLVLVVSSSVSTLVIFYAVRFGTLEISKKSQRTYKIDKNTQVVVQAPDTLFIFKFESKRDSVVVQKPAAKAEIKREHLQFEAKVQK